MKYSLQVAWRTICANVFQLTRETVDYPATYRATVSVVDSNNTGAGQKEIGFWITDFWGVPFLIVGTGSGYIDVEDYFRVGRCPTSGQMAVIYKSVYSGRAMSLSPDSFQHLHQLALQNSHRYEMAVIWANDPNAKKVPFINQATPTIVTYQTTQTDPEDSAKTVNYAEDFGENPAVRLVVTLDGTTKYHSMQNCFYTFVDGLIDTIYFDIGEDATGYISISRS